MQENLITAQVLVVESTAKKVWVKVNSCDSCSLCNAGGGCRSRLFNIFSRYDRSFPLDMKKGHNYHRGDNLLISCPENLPAILMFTVYFTPLLIFVILTALGHYAFSMSEFGIIMLALIGVVAYYWWLYVVQPIVLWQRLLSLQITKI